MKKKKAMNEVIPIFQVKNKTKSCGSCSACCSGVLTGEAYGHSFYDGRPCFFLTEKGCGIYENRPENPCVSYECAYLYKDFFPHWMRPDLSGAICTTRAHMLDKKHKDDEDEFIYYLQVLEYDKKLSAQTLMWFIENQRNGNIENLLIRLDGATYRFGSDRFVQLGT